MTDNLTIQTLAPYLAYRLQIDFSAIKYTLSGITKETMYTEEGPVFNYNNREFPQVIFPCLRPLSQLIQTIVHEGREFVPILELAKIFSGADSISYYNGTVSNYYYFKCEWNNIAGYEDLIISDKLEPWYKSYFEKNNSQYLGNNVINLWEGWQKLISWHFNVFNLPPELFIEKPAK